jgi:hypothetical protein
MIKTKMRQESVELFGFRCVNVEDGVGRQTLDADRGL